MKKATLSRPMLCTLLCASVLVSLLGCTKSQRPSADARLPDPAVPAAASGADTAARVSSAPNGADSARLPLENYDYILGELKNYRTLGAQPLTDDENAYALAEAIYRYRDYHNALIFDQPFSDITQADAALLVEIAVSQAPHVDLYSDAFFAAATDNPIRRFYDAQQKKGGTLGLVSYGDDVRRTAKNLFGDAYELPRQNGRSIRYNEAYDLYFLDAEGAAISTDYPMITAVSQSGTDGSVTVDAVRMCYSDSYGTWSTPNGAWESEEHAALEKVGTFVRAALDRLDRHRYTLAPTENGWRVIAFAKL